LSTFSSNPDRWEAETEGILPERDGTDDENAHDVEKEAAKKGDHIEGIEEEPVNQSTPSPVSEHIVDNSMEVSSDTEPPPRNPLEHNGTKRRTMGKPPRMFDNSIWRTAPKEGKTSTCRHSRQTTV